jgi:O-antigen/teichoic acid export membrane protein
MNVPALVVMVCLIEIALHYFPWRKVLQGHELPRPIAYALGVTGMMVPFTAWLIQCDHQQIAFVLWMVIGGAGLAVVLCYGFDWVIDLVWRLRESDQREQMAINELKDMNDAKSER